MSYKGDEIAKKWVSFRHGEQCMDELDYCIFVFRVRIDPTRINLRFLHRLEHVRLDTLTEFGQLCRVHLIQRPCANQCLIQRVLIVGTWRPFAVDLASASSVQATPATHV